MRKSFFQPVALMILLLIGGISRAGSPEGCCVIVIADTMGHICSSYPSFSASPNPSEIGFQLLFHDDFGSNTVSVMAKNANGNVVLSETNQVGGGDVLSIAADTWAKGLYTIAVTFEGCQRIFTIQVM